MTAARQIQILSVEDCERVDFAAAAAEWEAEQDEMAR